MPDEQRDPEQKQPKKRKRKRDPMAPRPGRKRGSTRLHQVLLPAHLEEVHERLIWDKLESVQAYIVQMGYIDDEGKPLISINQLKYYRGRFITTEERMGYGRLCQLLAKYRVRLPPIAAQETVISIQLQRIEKGIEEEEEAKTTIPQVGSDLDLIDKMIGRLYKMKQEAGLIPQPLPPVQRHQIQADVSQVTAQVQQQVGPDVPISKVKETLSQFKEFLMGEAQAAEEKRMKDHG